MNGEDDSKGEQERANPTRLGKENLRASLQTGRNGVKDKRSDASDLVQRTCVDARISW